jgi:hypothetical protein
MKVLGVFLSFDCILHLKSHPKPAFVHDCFETTAAQ